MSNIRPIIYADDSGDAGFSFGRGSSNCFVIAFVVFADEIDAEETDVLIKKYRRSLGWPQEREFKFHKTRMVIRTGFFQAIHAGSFSISAILVDKTKLVDNPSLNTSASFYNFIVKEALAHFSSFQNGRLKLDGKAENEYKRAVKVYLRKQLNEVDRALGGFSFVDSQNNSLIQLADMVAGAIRRTTETQKTDSQIYYNIIKEKIDEIWHYSP
jgi:hypothetical protein